MPSRVFFLSPRALFCGVMAALFIALLADAADCGGDAEGFPGFLINIRGEDAAAGVSQAAIESGLADVTYNQSVISHDRGQKVFHQSFEEFSGRMVNAFRLHKVAQLLNQNASLFSKIEQDYGVPGPVLVAIWGLDGEGRRDLIHDKADVLASTANFLKITVGGVGALGRGHNQYGGNPCLE
jgi:membrane-bound lytic murein transglycosylase B